LIYCCRGVGFAGLTGLILFARVQDDTFKLTCFFIRLPAAMLLYTVALVL